MAARPAAESLVEEMAERNTEIVRAAVEALLQRDVPGMLARLAPDVELIPARAVLEGTTYRGHDGFRRFVADMDEDWHEYAPTPGEIRDLGGNMVLVLGRFHGRGKASGVEFSADAAWLCELHDARITRVRFFADEAAALEAAAPGG